MVHTGFSLLRSRYEGSFHVRVPSAAHIRVCLFMFALHSTPRQLYTSFATSRLKTGLQPLKEVPEFWTCPVLKPGCHWCGMQNNVQQAKRALTLEALIILASL
ncbi:hypothetical protein E4U59_000521 [Claviceps monticola]|nr:hypothetical protein E4U59_000521 [Claviceps monticola]